MIGVTWVSEVLCNKAVVADGWAGGENLEKQHGDGPTDRPTDRRTKKWLIESRVRDLKSFRTEIVTIP